MPRASFEALGWRQLLAAGMRYAYLRTTAVEVKLMNCETVDYKKSLILLCFLKAAPEVPAGTLNLERDKSRKSQLISANPCLPANWLPVHQPLAFGGPDGGNRPVAICCLPVVPTE